ncbi:transposase [Pseudomonas sp. C2B4]|uniref:transposase n=1 Tax=Pseudomonas sp. C2B4 TaxID=2735270 RepID=UPI001586BCBB|nr:transposase [Pseudomonas sp. C2B4]NUU38277.1 transposase [Pseudomonas sp. C2B4]
MKLATFVERMDTYDLHQDKSRIIADLRELATNRTLLSEHLYNTLQRDGYSTKNSLYNAYAFVLHYSETYSVRLGFWAPVSSQDESETFIYHLNHTHDFEIFAVGYSGDGYTTVKRKILDQTPLRAGIRPPLGEETTLKLAQGEVMHMQPYYEVHRQLPPRNMSASLSLIIHAPPTTGAQAWCFDEDFRPTYPGIATQEVAFYEHALSLLGVE